MWHNKPGAIYGREMNKVSRGWKKWGRTRTEYLLGNLEKRGHTENPQDGLRCHDVQYIWLNLFSNMRTKGIWAWCFGKWKILYYWRGFGGCETVESCRWIMFRGGTVPHKCLYLPPMAQQPLTDQGLLIFEASRSHSDAPQSVGLLWTSDQPDAETST
jgi:hypothetical protein